jgi:hypothetical protein
LLALGMLVVQQGSQPRSVRASTAADSVTSRGRYKRHGWSPPAGTCRRYQRIS